jgi:hypothetical protein
MFMVKKKMGMLFYWRTMVLQYQHIYPKIISCTIYKFEILNSASCSTIVRAENLIEWKRD